MRDQTVAVGLDRTSQVRKHWRRRRCAGKDTASNDAAPADAMDLGEQLDLSGYVRYRRGHCLRRSEQRAFAGAFDRFAGHRVETGKRRARHQVTTTPAITSAMRPMPPIMPARLNATTQNTTNNAASAPVAHNGSVSVPVSGSRPGIQRPMNSDMAKPSARSTNE
jgi:hypothetical protein